MNRTTNVLKNITVTFYSFRNEQKITNLRMIDKLKIPYLMPEESTLQFKTLQYEVSKEFQFFAEVSYQNNAVRS